MIEILFLILFFGVFFYYSCIVLGYVLALVLVVLAIAVNLLIVLLRYVRRLVSWLLRKANIQIPTAQESKTESTPKKPYTTKEKLELTVGLIVVGYTLVLIAIATFTAMPLDVAVCIWFILNAVLSVIGNNKMKKIDGNADKSAV